MPTERLPPRHPGRRRALAALLALGAGAAPPLQLRAQPLPTAVVLDVELVDDHPNPLGVEALQRRLRQARADLQRQLDEGGLYRMLPLQDAALARLHKLQGEQEFMYRCEDCARQVGREAAVDYAVTSWVQKVSELILNFNIEVHDVARERVVLAKSVDLRGNDDVSWQRAVRFLVRDMVDKRRANPRYGL